MEHWMYLPGIRTVELVGYRPNSLCHKEWPYEPALELLHRCILQLDMLRTEEHLVSSVEFLFALSHVSVALLSLLGTTHELMSSCEGLLHLGQERVDTFKVRGVQVSDELHWCTWMIPIVQIERGVASRLRWSVVDGELHHGEIFLPLVWLLTRV